MASPHDVPRSPRPQHSHARLRRAVFATLLGTAAIVSACGSRGPLDILVINETPVDAATPDVTVRADASGDAADATKDVQAEALDAAIDAMDEVDMDAGALANCFACVQQYCTTQLITCFTSPGCQMAFQCVTSTCLTGGMPNFTCITNCTGGNQTTESQLLSVVGCLIGTCNCVSLGGLGGSSSGSGGGSGGD